MTDSKNILRLDLEEIYNECQGITEAKARALTLDPNVFAITSVVKNQVHQFAMEGASLIANNAGIVRNSSQTGLDALTYEQTVDEPDPIPTNEFDKEIPVNGVCTDENQKLDSGLMDIVLFEIEDVDGEQNRYTMVQTFIKSAMIHYILFKWYKMMGRADLASIEYQEYEEFNGKVRFNAVRTSNIKGIKRPVRFY